MKVEKYFAIIVLFATFILSGCAGTPHLATASNAAPNLRELPMLKVTVECGSCEVKPTIPALIVNSYNAAASKAGRRVSVTDAASLSIKEYSARGDAARFLAGAFAGKDEIKAVIVYQGKNYVVEDYYRNAWLGIETLAENIGGLAYMELK